MKAAQAVTANPLKAAQKLTLDTNCINVRQSLAAMTALEVLAAQNLVELVTATAMLDDLAFDKTRLAQARKDKAYRLLQGRGAFMVGHSHVGGDDVVGGPNIYAHIDAVAGALSDGQRWETLDSNSQRDALHLAAHLTYAFNAFVTLFRAQANWPPSASPSCHQKTLSHSSDREAQVAHNMCTSVAGRPNRWSSSTTRLGTTRPVPL